jgi:hypothetical protein
MKHYLYQSKAKIEALYRQIESAKKTSTKTKWKLNWGIASVERETQTSSEANDEDKLQAVLAELEAQELVGPLDENKPYIKGIFPMRWGLYNDSMMRPDNEGPLVWFSGVQEGVLLGMGGSSHHIVGMFGITSTSSRSATPMLVTFLWSAVDTGETPPFYRGTPRDERDELYSAMALANHYLRGPIQNMDFVAKVLSRDGQCRLEPFRDSKRGEAILATPL